MNLRTKIKPEHQLTSVTEYWKTSNLKMQIW